MAMNISYVQSVVALSAAETASNRMESGTEGVQRGEAQRKDLQKQIEAKQKEIEHLSQELSEAADKGWFESFCCWLVGSDGGVGELQDQIQTAAAELKKAQNQVQVEQAKIEMMLQELQGAQGELAQRTAEREKTWDDHGQAAQVAQS